MKLFLISKILSESESEVAQLCPTLRARVGPQDSRWEALTGAAQRELVPEEPSRVPLLGAAKSRAVLSTGYTQSIADNTKPAALRILTNGTGQWGDSVCNKEPAQCRRASWRRQRLSHRSTCKAVPTPRPAWHSWRSVNRVPQKGLEMLCQHPPVVSPESWDRSSPWKETP